MTCADAKTLDISKKQQRSLATKQALLEATTRLLSKYELSRVSVRDICSEAQVSCGSFYHHFQNKDDLLASYLGQGFMDFVSQNPIDQDSDLETLVVEGYLAYVRCLMSLGVDFVAHYYSTDNKALDYSSTNPTNAHSWLMRLLFDRLEAAERAGRLVHTTADEAFCELCMISKGCLFEWALEDGRLDLEYKVDRLLRLYMKAILQSRSTTELIG